MASRCEGAARASPTRPGGTGSPPPAAQSLDGGTAALLSSLFADTGSADGPRRQAAEARLSALGVERPSSFLPAVLLFSLSGSPPSSPPGPGAAAAQEIRTRALVYFRNAAAEAIGWPGASGRAPHSGEQAIRAALLGVLSSRALPRLHERVLVQAAAAASYGALDRDGWPGLWRTVDGLARGGSAAAARRGLLLLYKCLKRMRVCNREDQRGRQAGLVVPLLPAVFEVWRSAAETALGAAAAARAGNDAGAELVAPEALEVAVAGTKCIHLVLRLLACSALEPAAGPGAPECFAALRQAAGAAAEVRRTGTRPGTRLLDRLEKLQLVAGRAARDYLRAWPEHFAGPCGGLGLFLPLFLAEATDGGGGSARLASQALLFVSDTLEAAGRPTSYFLNRSLRQRREPLSSAASPAESDLRAADETAEAFQACVLGSFGVVADTAGHGTASSSPPPPQQQRQQKQRALSTPVDMFRLVVSRYLVLGPDDLRRWADEPEAYLAEEEEHDEARAGPRGAARQLLWRMFHERKFAPALVPALLEALRGATGAAPDPGAVPHPLPAAAFRSLADKEAAYYALGVAAVDLRDELLSWGGFEFAGFFRGTLRAELAALGVRGGAAARGEDPFRIVRGRVAWLLGEWSLAVPPDLRDEVYAALVALVRDGDLVVQLTAARAFAALAGSRLHRPPPEVLAGHLTAVVLELLRVVARVEGLETGRGVLELLRSLLGAARREEVRASVPSLMRGLEQIWQHFGAHPDQPHAVLLKQSVLDTCRQLVSAVGPASAGLHPLLAPLVAGIVTGGNAVAGRDMLLAPAVGLWRALVAQSPALTAELAALLPVWPQLARETAPAESGARELAEWLPRLCDLAQGLALLSGARMTRNAAVHEVLAGWFAALALEALEPPPDAPRAGSPHGAGRPVERSSADERGRAAAVQCAVAVCDTLDMLLQCDCEALSSAGGAGAGVSVAIARAAAEQLAGAAVRGVPAVLPSEPPESYGLTVRQYTYAKQAHALLLHLAGVVARMFASNPEHMLAAGIPPDDLALLVEAWVARVSCSRNPHQRSLHALALAEIVGRPEAVRPSPAAMRFCVSVAREADERARSEAEAAERRARVVGGAERGNPPVQQPQHQHQHQHQQHSVPGTERTEIDRLTMLDSAERRGAGATVQARVSAALAACCRAFGEEAVGKALASG